MALLVTAALAAGIGYLSLRVSGVYFLLVTMAFAQLLLIVATKWYTMTGGRDGLIGIPRPDLGFIQIDWNNLSYYYFVLIGFIICFLILHRIARSSFGRTLVGIRANEPRMRSLGYNTWALKYVALIIGGVFAGVAGALFAFDYAGMVPSYFALETSALPMLMVIIGGAATLWGPSLGAAVIILARERREHLLRGQVAADPGHRLRRLRDVPQGWVRAASHAAVGSSVAQGRATRHGQ